MKISPKSTVILSMLAALAPLDAAIEIWRGYLIPELAYSSEYTNNAGASAQASEDWINRLSPSIQYESVGSTWSTRMRVGMDIIRYMNREEDNENLNLSAGLSYPNGISLPYSFGVNTNLNETTQGDAEFGRVTRTRTYGLSSSGSYSFMPRYSIASGFTYSQSQPLDESANSDRSAAESFSIPLNMNYTYSEALSYGVGYQFGQQQSEASVNATESTTHAIYGNVSGQLLPLVAANFSLGAQMLQNDAGDDLGPYASGGLTWQASSLTSVSLNLSAGFQTTTGNRSSQQISIGSSLSHQFAHNLSGNLSAGLSSNEYSETGGSGNAARTDRSWNMGAGLSTTVYEHTSLSLSLSYRSNDSDQSQSQFDSYSITFSASRPF